MRKLCNCNELCNPFLDILSFLEAVIFSPGEIRLVSFMIRSSQMYSFFRSRYLPAIYDDLDQH